MKEITIFIFLFIIYIIISIYLYKYIKNFKYTLCKLFTLITLLILYTGVLFLFTWYAPDNIKRLFTFFNIPYQTLNVHGDAIIAIAYILPSYIGIYFAIMIYTVIIIIKQIKNKNGTA